MSKKDLSFVFVCTNVSSGCGISNRVGPKKQKNQHNQRKPLYFVNTMTVSSSKIGDDFRKKSGSNIEVRKNVSNKKSSVN